MFSLVSAHYERASMIVTSKTPFSGWGEISALKGDSYRLPDRDLGSPPPA
jgi:DNA replication protein DnaC